MFLCRRVSVLFRQNSSGSRKSVSSDNFIRFYRLRNVTVCREIPPNINSVYKWGLERTFCTHSNEIVREPAEDLLEDEMSEPDDHFGIEGDTGKGRTTEEIFQELAAGDPEKLKQLKLLEFEVAVLREEESKVPDKLTKSCWRELLGMDTLCKRKKFLSFLRLNELRRMCHQQKMAGKRDLWVKYKEQQGFHYYGLSGHTMFIRIYDKQINRLLANRLLNPRLKVLLDCSYQEYMSKINLKACAKQMFLTFTEARLNRYPCEIELCNFSREDPLGQILPRYVAGIYDNHFVNIHEESYLDLYPKEKLVYLTPHCSKPLLEFKHDDIYIIGAFVDKGTGVKASFAKAKEHNVRMAKFPIDEYLSWKKGTKCLSLNISLAILLDMAYYNDWRKAFKHIPQRNLTNN